MILTPNVKGGDILELIINLIIYEQNILYMIVNVIKLKNLMLNLRKLLFEKLIRINVYLNGTHQNNSKM